MTLTQAPPSPDLVIWPRLVNLLTCLCDSLAERHLPEPCVCAVMPGLQVATEYCNPCRGNKCGMAWVRLESIFPSSVFPVQDVTANGLCQAMMAFNVELGVVRCVPAGDEHGNPPDPQLMQDIAQQQVEEAFAMRAAVKCCFTQDKTMFGSYTPVGPEGGCVGATWTIAVSPQASGGAGRTGRDGLMYVSADTGL